MARYRFLILEIDKNILKRPHILELWLIQDFNGLGKDINSSCEVFFRNEGLDFIRNGL